MAKYVPSPGAIFDFSPFRGSEGSGATTNCVDDIPKDHVAAVEILHDVAGR
jgi:hypothetical protein